MATWPPGTSSAPPLRLGPWGQRTPGMPPAWRSPGPAAFILQGPPDSAEPEGPRAAVTGKCPLATTSRRGVARPVHTDHAGRPPGRPAPWY
jgi:hypothetical protein